MGELNMVNHRIRHVCAHLSTGAMVAMILASSGFAQTIDQAVFDGMRWRQVGPFRGGRAETATGFVGNPLVYYFGAVAGGVWKTTNGGASWTPITDRQGIFSIGAITIDPSNPDVLYVGTGEPCLRNDISEGDGVYKSTDGGRNWANIGLRDSRHIAGILVDPEDSKTVFVAAVGHAFGPNDERGVFRSRDGGQTWKKILYVDDKTGATDLVMDPHNPKILFAAMYEVRRTAYSMISGGPGSGLYKSTDGGDTWQHIEGHGLPGGILGRIGVAVSGADSNRVYAMIEAKENALYRSDDGGQNWQMVNDEPIWVRPWYGNHVFADPKNRDVVYILDLGAMRSGDGGHKFSNMPVPHSDDHHLWIDPENPQRMIEADDGGASISQDGGATWSPENNQPTAQFYHVATDKDFNYTIFGSQQDSGSVAIRSRSDSGSISDRDWHSVGGGESGFNWPDPRDSAIVYGGDHNGHFTRYDGHTGEVQDIAPWFGARAHPPAELKHRFQWTAPMLISPHDPGVLYIGGEVLFKSTTGGQSWTIISPDLTRNDKSKQQSSPTPLTPDNSSSEYYDTIFAISESPLQKGLIWVGSDDGLVHLTRDGGKSWSKITPPQLPEWACVNIIEASPYSVGTAYLAADLHFSDDRRPMIFKTVDYGKTWKEITHGIPANDYVHSIHSDPERKGLLYAGTETGIFVSFDDGENWQSLQLNLPHTPVFDTGIHGNDLIAATHGRAFWVLDDITPLRQANSQMTNLSAYLYKPESAVRVHGGGGGGGRGGGMVGQNPPSGAIIDYYLSAAPSGPVSLDILSSSGDLLHHVTSATAGQQPDAPDSRGRRRNNVAGSLSAHAGMNRYVWNLRVNGPEPLPSIVVMEIRGGPAVPPGAYRVRLTVDGKQYTAPLDIKIDPRLHVTQADLQKQYDFAIELRDRVTEVHRLVLQIQQARAGLEAARSSADSSKQQTIADLDSKLDALEQRLTQVKSTNSSAALVYPIMLDAQYADLGNVLETADSAPPQQTYQVFQDYERQRKDIEAQWKLLEPQVAQLAPAATAQH
ncbi:MAG TPA: glycosyl hydrolase [Bryobacteraceae bacterium]|nr:glycosyl hydrolase [Bryobacteraceae bacterium]